VVFSFLLGLGLAAAAPAFSEDAPPTATKFDRTRYMGVDELAPGMKGFGLSVFSGSAVDTFWIEIVAVRHNYFPQSDMILARGSGNGLETAGIAAGMSGSPIYIDGRLVGALAYGWPFMVAPIMGITPIEAMLELLDAADRDVAAGGGGGASSGEGRAAWRALLTSRGEAARELIGRLNAPAAPRSMGEARPIGSPLWLSGFDSRVASGLEEWLGPLGFMPVAAGAAGEGKDDPGLGPEALVPGATIGVQLVRGDASASAIGTVTWREGNRILAFGHPLFHKGRTSYPMTTGTIETVMPRLNDSFKFGSASRVVGTVDVDLRPGISGLIGPAPRMVPVVVKVEDELAGNAQTFNYEVTEDEELTGPFTAYVTSNSLLTHGKEIGDATLDITTRVVLSDGRTVDAKNSLTSSYLPGAVAMEVARPIGLLLGNPMEKVSIGSVQVDVAVRHKLESLTLEEVVLGNSTPTAGENLDVVATFRNYRGVSFNRTFTMPLPLDLPAGTYKLRVCDAGDYMTWNSQRAPGLYDPQSVDQIIEILNAEKSFNTLVLTLVDSRPGVSAGGEELGRLPPSVLAALAAPGVAGAYDLTKGTVLAQQDVVMEGMVSGCVEMDVKAIDNPRGVRSPEGKN
jgi:hypothetical protein